MLKVHQLKGNLLAVAVEDVVPLLVAGQRALGEVHEGGRAVAGNRVSKGQTVIQMEGIGLISHRDLHFLHMRDILGEGMHVVPTVEIPLQEGKIVLIHLHDHIVGGRGHVVGAAIGLFTDHDGVLHESDLALCRQLIVADAGLVGDIEHVLVKTVLAQCLLGQSQLEAGAVLHLVEPAEHLGNVIAVDGVALHQIELREIGGGGIHRSRSLLQLLIGEGHDDVLLGEVRLAVGAKDLAANVGKNEVAHHQVVGHGYGIDRHGLNHGLHRLQKSICDARGEHVDRFLSLKAHVVARPRNDRVAHVDGIRDGFLSACRYRVSRDGVDRRGLTLGKTVGRVIHASVGQARDLLSLHVQLLHGQGIAAADAQAGKKLGIVGRARLLGSLKVDLAVLTAVKAEGAVLVGDLDGMHIVLLDLGEHQNALVKHALLPLDLVVDRRIERGLTRLRVHLVLVSAENDVIAVLVLLHGVAAAVVEPVSPCPLADVVFLRHARTVRLVVGVHQRIVLHGIDVDQRKDQGECDHAKQNGGKPLLLQKGFAAIAPHAAPASRKAEILLLGQHRGGRDPFLATVPARKGVARPHGLGKRTKRLAERGLTAGKRDSSLCGVKNQVDYRFCLFHPRFDVFLSFRIAHPSGCLRRISEPVCGSAPQSRPPRQERRESASAPPSIR